MNILNNLRKPSLSIVLLSLVFFYSCDQEESKILDVSSEIELVSPRGFEIADNITHLKQILELPESSKIENVIFEESDKFNVSFIDYIDKDGVQSNYAIGIGALKFYSNEIQMGGNDNSSKSMNRKWKISCGGCNPCGVGGNLDSEGNMTFQCESECCVLTVEEILEE
ncbi:MAG: Uncharacterised protein [Flavobacterium sp. SCGC AAA160-P02]|nr:MAG: Uncharacterised protein [Flavobacterium sp. SCGC AAA160-P02]